MKNTFRGLAILAALWLLAPAPAVYAQTFTVKGKMKKIGPGQVSCNGGGVCCVIQIPPTPGKETPATVTLYGDEVVTWNIEPEYEQVTTGDGSTLYFTVIE